MHRGKGNSAVKPHYQALCPKNMEQIPDGMSRQMIHNSTVDTELTINVRNLVAKIRKSNIIELL